LDVTGSERRDGWPLRALALTRLLLRRRGRRVVRRIARLDLEIDGLLRTSRRGCLPLRLHRLFFRLGGGGAVFEMAAVNQLVREQTESTSGDGLEAAVAEKDVFAADECVGAETAGPGTGARAGVDSHVVELIAEQPFQSGQRRDIQRPPRLHRFGRKRDANV